MQTFNGIINSSIAFDTKLKCKHTDVLRNIANVEYYLIMVKFCSSLKNHTTVAEIFTTGCNHLSCNHEK